MGQSLTLQVDSFHLPLYLSYHYPLESPVLNRFEYKKQKA